MEEAQFKALKERIPNFDETKIKNLEARFNGPSSNGKMPIEFNQLLETDLDAIKSKLSNSSEQLKGSNDSLKEIFLKGETTNEINHSNKSFQSFKRKTPSKKAEKKTKIAGNHSMDFLTIKRNRDNTLNNSSVEKKSPTIRDLGKEIDEAETDDFIEFTSKNNKGGKELFSHLKDTTINFNLMTPKTNNNNNNNNFFSNNFSTSGVKSISYKSDTKINHIFNKINTNIESSSKFEKMERLNEEVFNLKKENFEKTNLLNEKNKLIDSLKKTNEELDEELTKISEKYENCKENLKFTKFSLITFLKDLEESKRLHNKIQLNEKALRLGKFTFQRTSTKLIESFEDGEDFLKIRRRLAELSQQKDELEKQRKKISYIKKKEIKESNLTGENEDILEETEYELNDQKELISLKINLIVKEEQELKDKLEKLEAEKVLYQLEYKRVLDEEKCRYGSLQSPDRWPLFHGRYQLLSLLGKGGYSEVYRAYDLETNKEVACKIHQLNPQWSDTIKENYIKHTIRENQIHKEINHPKVVKHHDTIEIDSNSFCTVLELCTGPDLYTYLKLHRTLSEKEAKMIISQILSGLKYLNSLPKKIIHYDLKPQNIIFHNGEIKISDFGLAKIMEDNTEKIELTSQGVGTYWYLPPECFDTSKNPPGISSKVDVWSVGVILYELLFGFRPFGHAMSQDRILKEGVIVNARKVEFPPKPPVSDSCKEFIRKCLSYKQEERYNVIEAYSSSYFRNTKK